MKRFLRYLPLLLVLLAGMAFVRHLGRLRQVRYAVTLLEAPGEFRCDPIGLNDTGMVVVTSDTGPDGRIGSYAAFGYACEGGAVDLVEAAEPATLAAVNARGDMVGWLGNPRAYPRRAALWRDGRRSTLSPDALGGEAHALNDAGVVVGSVNLGQDDADGRQYAARWKNGRLTNLGRWPGTDDWHSVANDINDAGVIVGSTCGSGYRQMEPLGLYLPAFAEAGVWKDGRFTPLPKPASHLRHGSSETSALAINNRDQIAGYRCWEDGRLAVEAVLWDGASARALPLPRPCNSVARDINNAGQIVGAAMVAPTWRVNWRGWRNPWRMFYRIYDRSSAVLWDGGTGRDLNDLIPPFSGWHLDRALAINDKGQIAGTGAYNGRTRAFLLTPVPSR